MTTATLALIFPGQGSQQAGMGRALAERYPEARRLFDEADAVLGRSISRLCFEGPEEELQRTVNTQPALYVTSAAALAALRAEGMDGGAVAGHSLGEYTALYAGGAIDFATGLRLVQARGEAMEVAGKQRPGAMAAVLGLDDGKVEGVCRDCSGPDGVVVAANLNSPGQIVLSGDEVAVDRACARATAEGAKRAIKLKVGGAFHSPLMQPAVDLMRPKLEGATISAPRLRFVANVSADFVEEPEAIRGSLILQITSCVRWTQCVERLRDAGCGRFVEVGSGKVLAGLLKRIDKSLAGASFGSPEDLAGVRAVVS